MKLSSNVPQLESPGFSGHETFPFRYAWLPKAVRECAADRNVFLEDDAMVRFGVGKNMVRSIRHWGLATGVLEEEDNPGSRARSIVPSEFGRSLFGDNGWDPYFEDPATAWLIHWQLAHHGRRSTTWYWTFSHSPQLEFSREDLVGWLVSLSEQKGWGRAGSSTLTRDVDCFIRTYVPTRATKTQTTEDTLDSPLVELGLIRDFGRKGNYFIQRGPQPSLPDVVFAYAILDFISGRGSSARTVPLDTLGFSAGSPGRVFCLSEDALLHRLEGLEQLTSGAIVYDDTAGLRQLLLNEELPSPTSLLASHYGTRCEGTQS